MKLQTLSTIHGNYMGYLDIDGKRYFDVREQNIQPIIPFTNDNNLQTDGSKVYCMQSDSRLRIDSLQLEAGDVVQAQTNKEAIERMQRHDRTLREAA